MKQVGGVVQVVAALNMVVVAICLDRGLLCIACSKEPGILFNKVSAAVCKFFG